MEFYFVPLAVFSITLVILVFFNSYYELSDASVGWSGDLADFPANWPITKGSCKPGLCSIIENPTDDGDVGKVMRVEYPKDSCGSACGIESGVSIYVNPTQRFTGNESFVYYEVYFPGDFDFVKGGKLPGLVGGLNKKCSGCNRDERSRSECFSARIVWQANGTGCPYLYVPLSANHTREFCGLVSGKSCDPDCGMKFNPGQYFLRGQWNTVLERVVMNSVGTADGLLQVWINKELKVDFAQVIWRVNEKVRVNGFVISSFFGGSDASFAPLADTFALFRHFKFYEPFKRKV